MTDDSSDPDDLPNIDKILRDLQTKVGKKIVISQALIQRLSVLAKNTDTKNAVGCALRDICVWCDDGDICVRCDTADWCKLWDSDAKPE